MVARALLLIVAVLNLVPAIVAVAPSWSARLYGIPLTDASLEVAMRHRGVMLGSVGAGLAIAAFHEAWWAPALALAIVSKVGFLLLWGRAAMPRELRRIALADVFALAALGVVAWLSRA